MQACRHGHFVFDARSGRKLAGFDELRQGLGDLGVEWFWVRPVDGDVSDVGLVLHCRSSFVGMYLTHSLLVGSARGGPIVRAASGYRRVAISVFGVGWLATLSIVLTYVSWLVVSEALDILDEVESSWYPAAAVTLMCSRWDESV